MKLPPQCKQKKNKSGDALASLFCICDLQKTPSSAFQFTEYDEKLLPTSCCAQKISKWTAWKDIVRGTWRQVVENIGAAKSLRVHSLNFHGSRKCFSFFKQKCILISPDHVAPFRWWNWFDQGLHRSHYKLLHTFLEDPKTTWVLPCHQIFGVFFALHTAYQIPAHKTTKRHLQISYLTCQAVKKIANMQFHSVVWHRKQKTAGFFCAKIMLSHPCSSISSQK